MPFGEIKENELFPAESGKRTYLELEGELRRREQKYMQQARFLSQLYNSVPCGIIQFERGEGSFTDMVPRRNTGVRLRIPFRWSWMRIRSGLRAS